ncbi:MAG TPA: endonuclease III [Acidobacteriaceae bacterium]|nr:endonuclease III [Acidobacteriaceae bacterium]
MAATKGRGRGKASRKASQAASEKRRVGSAKAGGKAGVTARGNESRKPSQARGKKPGRAAGPGLELDPKRIADLLDRLQKAYPNAECALHHSNAWELLVATILSAQCTDARVNMVTPGLFRKFPTPQAFAAATLPAIEEEIRSTGFYHNKAKSISGAAKKLIADFGGRVPEAMAELLTLPGVARKTANVVLGVAFGKAEGVVVDTHVLRLSHRLGLTRAEDPKKVEEDLMRIIPRDRWIAFSHEMIHHGRQICIARKPRCVDCPLETLCHAPDKTWSSV